MKTKIISLGLALVASHIVTAQPVMTTYADVFPATESRLGSLSATRKIEDTAAASATYASFARKIVFPDGTTSVTFTSASFAVESYANGNYTIHNPAGVNMAASKFNPEGDVSLPSIFARTSANALILPVNSNLVGTPLANVKTFLITEHKANLPTLDDVGDYWKLYASLAGTYTIGTGPAIPFSFDDRVATVILVNETNVPVSGVSSDYPSKNAQITSITVAGGLTTLTVTGVTLESYNKTWWVQTSTILAGWITANNATVTSNGTGVTITFPFVPGDLERFWRIYGLQP